jgi:peptidoglycan/xylan/chitin deacetylase (PgdA/CDA1 family)
VKATFFTLGWVARRQPALIRRIVEGGHELASHGLDHARVFTLGADGFAADLLESRKILEDAGGVAITGYRAPSFSIDPRTVGPPHSGRAGLHLFLQRRPHRA